MMPQCTKVQKYCQKLEKYQIIENKKMYHKIRKKTLKMPFISSLYRFCSSQEKILKITCFTRKNKGKFTKVHWCFLFFDYIIMFLSVITKSNTLYRLKNFQGIRWRGQNGTMNAPFYLHSAPKCKKSVEN